MTTRGNRVTTFSALSLASVLTVLGCSPTPATPATPATHTAPGTQGVPVCPRGDLSVKVAVSGSVASQPFLVISLTSHGSSRCRLHGYPDITATGHPAGRSMVRRLRVIERRGPIYERSDPGDRTVTLQREAVASFSLGTATAFQGGRSLATITAISFRVPGIQQPFHVRTSMLASAPAGAPIPIGVTALTPGLH